MSLTDKLAIQDVIAQYSYTYDAQDAEGFAALFTEDAVWELFSAGSTHPAIRLDSRAAILAWATQRMHDRRGRFISRHYQSSRLFDALTAESARTRTMVLVTHQEVTEAAPRPMRRGCTMTSGARHRTDGDWSTVDCIMTHVNRLSPHNGVLRLVR
jgi:uncharacterized protein (TIGR02246 family)